MRGIARRLRSNFGIRSSRMTIRSHLAWYWRWLLNILMMAAVAGIVWWLVENSYRITGFNREEAATFPFRVFLGCPRADDLCEVLRRIGGVASHYNFDVRVCENRVGGGRANGLEVADRLVGKD